MANAAKRLQINKIAHDEKTKAMAHFQKELEMAFERAKDEVQNLDQAPSQTIEDEHKV